MKKNIALSCFLLSFFISNAQGNSESDNKKKPVLIFNSTKTINTRTTEVTGAGKLDFNITHNFGDIAGSNGGIKRFFGLDNASDIRIGFHIGLGNKTDFVFARDKGASAVQGLYEFGIKHQVVRQYEKDPSHPISIALYINTVIASQKSSSFENQDNSFSGFPDRISNIFQIILAKKVKALSLQLNPTFMNRGYAISYDQKSMFSLGGALKFPVVANRLNLIIDYFHNFRNQASKDSFLLNNSIRFYDPLGVGFEILTSGHTFRLNFTNSTEILENRFIPRTVTSWAKGQFRWGFTISRKFTVWRPKYN